MSVGEIYVNVQGRVGSEVEFKQAGQVPIASFRLASTPRQFNRGEWSDKPTTWFTVECWRTLAQNVRESLAKGQPVLVSGKLKTTEWKDEETGQPRSKTVLDAFSVGHDLARGTAKFAKNPGQVSQPYNSLDEEMRNLGDRAEQSAERSPFPPHGFEEGENQAPVVDTLALAKEPSNEPMKEPVKEPGKEEVGAQKARRAA